ncbi:hypothetical protein GWK47_040724 [Chionoecetes opilio]|uniref:Uncharacterized protein n=1 Tax=Chionoecetes opilio TaxID=41210 RepID=A0A8J5CL29_CHIOP|nr:hypothetical protein GWK47_040724 [Chionoecetes opilio]
MRVLLNIDFLMSICLMFYSHECLYDLPPRPMMFLRTTVDAPDVWYVMCDLRTACGPRPHPHAHSDIACGLFMPVPLARAHLPHPCPRGAHRECSCFFPANVKDKLMRSATHGGVRVKPDWSLLAVTATGDQSQPGPSGNSDQPTTDQWHWSVVGWSPEAAALVHLNNMLRFASPYKDVSECMVIEKPADCLGQVMVALWPKFCNAGAVHDVMM